jgi:hypothetical protein
MSEPHQQPEGMSRQAVCVLIGGLAGFGLAARLLFDDYASAGILPWATALGIILGGCIVGFFVGVLFVGGEPDRGKQPPPPETTPRRSDTPSSEGITEQPGSGDQSIRKG